jgi:hypothetical protein
MRRLAVIAMTSFLAAACNDNGESESCPADCLDRLEVSMRSADGTWPGGEYVVTSSADVGTGVCDVKLPENWFLGCCTPHCDGRLGLLIYPERCTDAASRPCSFSLVVLGSPAQVELNMEHDGVEFFRGTIVPTYESSMVCDIECRVATAELTVTIP